MENASTFSLGFLYPLLYVDAINLTPSIDGIFSINSDANAIIFWGVDDATGCAVIFLSERSVKGQVSISKIFDFTKFDFHFVIKATGKSLAVPAVHAATAVKETTISTKTITMTWLGHVHDSSQEFF